VFTAPLTLAFCNLVKLINYLKMGYIARRRKMKKRKHAAWKVLFTVALASVMAFGGMQAQEPRHWIGAIGKDGTTSTATGSGACSHHGGVSCWQYSDGTCTKP
jgi:hypothetical protein